MESPLAKYKKFVWIALAVLILLFAWMIYDSTRFKISSMTPSNKNYPASLATMTIEFSKPIDQQDAKSRLDDDGTGIVTANFDGKVRVQVFEQSLQLTFEQTPLPGSYELKLLGIKSTNGTTITKTLPLIVKDRPYDDLSAEEQELADELGRESADDIFSDFPLLEKLPYDTSDYKIGYEVDHNHGSDEGHETDTPRIIITLKSFAPGNNAVPATPAEQAAYLQSIREHRRAALAWIESKGANLNDYSLVYSEPELREEFPSGKPQ